MTALPSISMRLIKKLKYVNFLLMCRDNHQMSTSLKYSFSFFAALIAATVPASGFAVQSDFGDWQLSCPEAETSCVLSQTAAASDQTWLATLRVALGEGDNAIVQFLVPPSVHLASGLFVTVSPGISKQATFIRCLTVACEAVLELDSETLNAWKRGRSAELRYRASPDTQPLIFDISLMGLTAALDAAESERDVN